MADGPNRRRSRLRAYGAAATRLMDPCRTSPAADVCIRLRTTRICDADRRPVAGCCQAMVPSGLPTAPSQKRVAPRRAESRVYAGEPRFIVAVDQRPHGRVATRSSFCLVTAVMFPLPGCRDRAELLRPTLAPLT